MSNLFQTVLKEIWQTEKGISVSEIVNKYPTDDRLGNHNFVESEIKRIRQVRPFSAWIECDTLSKKFTMNKNLRACPFESVEFMVKYLYKTMPKEKFDLNMNQVKSSAIKNVSDPNKELAEKFDYFMNYQNEKF
jgi:hypothetical protein